MAPVVPLNSRDFLRETKKRASNWVMYSFSTALHLEDHMTLKHYRFKPHELVEVSSSFLYRVCSLIHSMTRFIDEENMSRRPAICIQNHTSTRLSITDDRKESIRQLSARNRERSAYAHLHHLSISKPQCRLSGPRLRRVNTLFATSLVANRSIAQIMVNRRLRTKVRANPAR